VASLAVTGGIFTAHENCVAALWALGLAFEAVPAALAALAVGDVVPIQLAVDPALVPGSNRRQGRRSLWEDTMFLEAPAALHGSDCGWDNIYFFHRSDWF